ncbi:MAG TPA: hypothetical protein VHF22_01640, partial [Planctomycetota bacterium]|nr:hypothetical protein [Planctomycetota bacterium]
LVEHRLTCHACDAGWSRAGASWRADQVSRWSRALRLSPPQEAQLGSLLDEVKPRYDAVYAAVRERRAPVDRDFQERLRAIASAPDQRARLDDMLARDAARRSQYYGPATPLPGAPQPASDDGVKVENTAQ